MLLQSKKKSGELSFVFKGSPQKLVITKISCIKCIFRNNKNIPQ